MVALFSSPLSHRVAYPTFWNPKMRYFQFHWKRNLLDAYQSAAKHGASCNLLWPCVKQIYGVKSLFTWTFQLLSFIGFGWVNRHSCPYVKDLQMCWLFVILNDLEISEALIFCYIIYVNGTSLIEEIS